MWTALVLFIFIALTLFFYGKKTKDFSNAILLVIGWFVKCLAGIGFVYVYTFYYGKGKLSEDSGAFLREAKILANVKKQNPEDFYQIFFSAQSSEKLITKYFENNSNSRFSRQQIGINDTRNTIKFLTVLEIATNGNDYLVFLVFFLLSYLGIIYLWNALSSVSKMNSKWIFALLLLPPSMLFWTSNNLKEPIFMLGICLILPFLIHLQIKTKEFYLALLGFLILLFFKPLVFLILVFGWFLYYLFVQIVQKKSLVSTIITLVICALLFVFLVPSKTLNIISDKQFDFINVGKGGYHILGDTCFYHVSKKYEDSFEIKDSVVLVKKALPAMAIAFQKIRNEKDVLLQPGSENLQLIYYQQGGGSTFEITPINNSWKNLFKAIPEGIINSFFRPFPFENGFSVLNLFFFLENLVFAFLIIRVLKVYKHFKTNNLPLFWTVLIFIVLLSTIIGITTPVSGAILRYHIPIQLLIITVFILTLTNNERK